MFYTPHQFCITSCTFFRLLLQYNFLWVSFWRRAFLSLYHVFPISRVFIIMFLSISLVISLHGCFHCICYYLLSIFPLCPHYFFHYFIVHCLHSRISGHISVIFSTSSINFAPPFTHSFHIGSQLLKVLYHLSIYIFTILIYQYPCIPCLYMCYRSLVVSALTACYGVHRHAVFLYCCPDCPSCLAHLNRIGWVAWVIRPQQ